MENISNFVQVARDLGVRPDDVFQTPDLYEGGNMTQVRQDMYVSVASHLRCRVGSSNSVEFAAAGQVKRSYQLM